MPDTDVPDMPEWVARMVNPEAAPAKPRSSTSVADEVADRHRKRALHQASVLRPPTSEAPSPILDLGGGVAGGDEGAKAYGAHHAALFGNELRQQAPDLGAEEIDKRQKQFEGEATQAAKTWQLKKILAETVSPGRGASYWASRVPILGSIKDIDYYGRLHGAASRFQEDKATAEDYAHIAHYLTQRGSDQERTFAGKAFDTATGLIPMVGEWALTGPAGATGRQAAQVSIRKALGSLVEGGIGRVAGKAAELAAEGAARTVANPLSVAAGAAELMVPTLTPDEQGNITVGPAKALAPEALKSAWSKTIENAVFSAGNPLAARAEDAFLMRFGKGLGHGIGAAELNAELQQRFAGAPEGSTPARLWAARGKPEEQAKILEDFAAQVAAFGGVEGVLNARAATSDAQAMLRRMGYKVDPAILKEVASDVLTSQAPAGNARPADAAAAASQTTAPAGGAPAGPGPEGAGAPPAGGPHREGLPGQGPQGAAAEGQATAPGQLPEIGAQGDASRAVAGATPGPQAGAPGQPGPAGGAPAAWPAPGVLDERQGYGRRPVEQLPTPPGAMPPGESVSEAAIAKTIAKDFDLPVRRGRVGSEPGKYDPKYDVVRTATGNLGVLSHELAHSVDKNSDVMKGVPSVAEAELRVLHNDMLEQVAEDPRTTPSQLQWLEQAELDPKEGFAEFLRHYLTTGQAAAEAPMFAKHFEEWLGKNPEMKAKLDKAQGLITQYRSQPVEQEFATRMVQPGEKVEPIGVKASEKYAEKAITGWNRFVTATLNEHNPVRMMEREARAGGYKPGPGESAYEAVTGLDRAAPAYTERAYKEGVFDIEKGERLGPALEDVYKLAGITDDGRRRDFSLYLAAQDALEKHSWGQDRFAGRYSEEDLKKIVAQHDSPEFRQAAGALQEHRNATLDMLVGVGRLSAEDAERIKHGRPLDDAEKEALKKGAPSSEFYAKYAVPMRRLMEGERLAGGGAGSTLEMGSAVRSRKKGGSDRPFIDPLLGIQEETARRTQMALDTIQLKRLVEAAEKGGGMGKWVEEVDPKKYRERFNLQEVKKQLEDLGVDEEILKDIGPAQLSVWRRNLSAEPKNYIGRLIVDGKERLFQLDPELHAWAADVPNDSMLPAWLKTVARIAPQIERYGAIIGTTKFPLRKLSYDILSHLFQREHSNLLDPLTKGLPTVLKERLGKAQDPFYQLMDETGVMHNQLGGHRPEELVARAEKMQDSAAQRRRLNILDKIVHGPGELLKAVDETFRVAEFRAALEKRGYTAERLKQMIDQGQRPPLPDLLYARNAAVTAYHDYTRRGAFTAKWNSYIPFLTSSISAAEMPFRALAANPKQLAVRMAAAATGVIAYTLARRQDDDYKEKPPWDKYGFFSLTSQGAPTVRIARHGAYGSFLAGVEAITNAILDREPGAMKDWAEHSAAHAFIPPHVPGLIEPATHIWSNEDWRGRPIVSDEMAKREKPEQYGPGTSSLAKELGQVTGSSPAKIDYLLRGYTGGMYGTGQYLAEAARGNRPANMSDTPFVGGLLYNAEPSRSLNDFYDERNTLNRKLASEKFNTGEADEGIRDKVKRIGEYGALISKLGDLNRGDQELPKSQRVGKGDRDERFGVEKYRIGLARAALGREDLGRYPNPLKADDLPPEVATVVDQWLGRVMMRASAPEPRRQHGETEDHFEERKATWESSTKDAKQIVAEAKLTPVRQRELLQKVAAENQARRRGLSAEAAQLRVWGNQGLSAYGKRLQHVGAE